ncbi:MULTISPECIES: M23 family metallopeptidase [Streptomyces]|uniref:M23 family metallopeptidase n=1 Tax=Streptomyces TaxID=1883 RepID=UPI00163C3C26|nr:MULTISPECIES: M23 family metallopeptidase [Streptomyces]MBC2874713.1 M23 family metallopeptidase [Streptomyces sp. TYQ1024]UBI36530.1 M23 family metallopeptidase [Streptomyces mobaraensis]UKW29122.1 M23 family metallopeptidase [Streptomyces sp. TYQ1024]
MSAQRISHAFLTAVLAVILLVGALPAAAGGPVRPSPAAPPAAPPGDAARAWPVGTRPAIPRGWEPPAVRWARGHRGVDLAAAPGDPVRAAAGGVVSFAGTVAGRGVVSVELTGTGDPPLRTTYEPVRAGVRRGDRVAAGDVLGALGPGPWHCAGGCLHWGLLRGREYLDPLGLLPGWMLRRGPSRLLPLSLPQRGHPHSPFLPGLCPRTPETALRAVVLKRRTG